MKFSDFDQKTFYWNKYKRSQPRGSHAVSNYFHNSRQKKNDYYFPESPRYQTLKFQEDFEIKVLQKVAENAFLTPWQQRILKKGMHFMKDGNDLCWVSMKEMFYYYQQYLEEKNQVQKILLNGTALNKMIKPFLQMYRKLKSHNFQYEVGEKTIREDLFRIFSSFVTQKTERGTAKTNDRLYETLLAEHEKFCEQKENINEQMNKKIESFSPKFLNPINLVKKKQKMAKKFEISNKFKEIFEDNSSAQDHSLSYELQQLHEKAQNILYDKR